MPGFNVIPRRVWNGANSQTDRESLEKLSFEHRSVLILHEFEDLEIQGKLRNGELFHWDGDVALFMRGKNGGIDGGLQTRRIT